jgi:hypothetical protein
LQHNSQLKTIVEGQTVLKILGKAQDGMYEATCDERENKVLHGNETIGREGNRLESYDKPTFGLTIIDYDGWRIKYVTYIKILA